MKQIGDFLITDYGSYKTKTRIRSIMMNVFTYILKITKHFIKIFM